MLDNYKLENILFLDIETVPEKAAFDELSPIMQKLWSKKADKIKPDTDTTVEETYKRAGIYAEFGKIICISAGFIKIEKEKKTFRLKSFYSDDEKTILTNFFNLLNNNYSSPNMYLCGHNAKEFDFPYIARRGLINGLSLPDILDLAGKKPWEVQHLDTMQLWKFGDYKNYTSLELLASIFNIPTPKDDIDGSMVGEVYWKEKDLERIATYCEKDVITTAQIYLRFSGNALLEKDNIQVIR